MVIRRQAARRPQQGNPRSTRLHAPSDDTHIDRRMSAMAGKRTLGIAVGEPATAYISVLIGGLSVDETAIQILGSNRTMAISTLRLDGWPQTTIVGYANEGLVVYFLIFRSSQKFANIQLDDRVSIAVGQEPMEVRDLKAVFAGAHASEVTDTKEGAQAWHLLVRRHPNLAAFKVPEGSEIALMRAMCEHVSVLDYSKGLGHHHAPWPGPGDAPIRSS